MRKLITAMAVSMAVIALASEARPRKAEAKPVVAPINIEAVVDSALIMADNYADAIAEKPEMAPTRLNVLRSYVGAKPAEARDSICSRLYAFFVNYTESEKAERAAAFRDCFLAVAPPDSPHLGPLYAAELQVASENADTASLVRFIPMLDAYASRLGYDYDAELVAARTRLNSIRNRRPIRDAIAGVWVSEDVAGVMMPDGLSYFNYPEKKMSLINTMKVLQIRDTDNPLFRIDDKINFFETLDSVNLLRNGGRRNLDIIKCRENLSALKPLGTSSWYVPLYAWELPAYNMDALPDEYVGKTTSFGGPKFWGLTIHDPEHLTKTVITDDNSYSIYAFWGDERLKRNPAEVGAMLRQSIQLTQSSVAGELSRSKYSFSESLAGNLAAGIVSAGLNALIDSWMVSTEKIWSVEATLHMENPYKLSAVITAQLIISKSNSSKPEVYVSQHVANYYRWEEADGISLMGTDFREYKPWAPLYGPILLHHVTKEEQKQIKERHNAYSKDWETRYKALIADKKEKMKALPKGSAEREAIDNELKQLQQRPPQVWIDWNREQLARLKAKADNYKE